ncbi:MAG: hypothetical protein ACLP1X_28695 [Polyangiaceae bacterium]
MNKRPRVILFAVLAASIGFGSIGYAQPRPMPPGERPLRPGERPLPPGERVPPPGYGTPYALRLQKLNDDRLLRRAAERRDMHAWEAGRAARELEHRRDLEGVWGPAFLSRPECRAELELHAERLARLHRIIDLAEDQHATALLEHARAVLNHEIARNARAMSDIRFRLGIQ